MSCFEKGRLIAPTLPSRAKIFWRSVCNRPEVRICVGRPILAAADS